MFKRMIFYFDHMFIEFRSVNSNKHCNDNPGLDFKAKMAEIKAVFVDQSESDTNATFQINVNL